MSLRESTDVAAAFLIGTALGVGATLLLRADVEDRKRELVRMVRRLRRSRRRSGAGARMRAMLEAARDRW